jgi:hypothetical protein
MRRPRVRERRSYPGDGRVPYFSEGKTDLEYQVNWWLTYLHAVRSHPKRGNWRHEDFVLYWIAEYKKVFPFPEVTAAVQKNDIRFLRAVLRALDSGREPEFDATAHIIIRLWNNPVAPGLPKLSFFTDPAGRIVLRAALLAHGRQLNDEFTWRHYRNKYERVLRFRLASGPHVREVTSEMEDKITASERRFPGDPNKRLFGVEPAIV